MHELFTTVLSKRDLSRAGELFSIADYEIVNDLTEVLEEICSIISQEDYLQSSNDQSVIEICINRVTSCIKKTNTIEKHCGGLVKLLQTCLRYNLQPSGKDVDPPHAKISSDIISSIFLNYNKQIVMEVTLPVAVKFLNLGNLELSRNLASYLSSAAIEYSFLLSPHVHVILESLLAGNYGLCHVLSQIYEATPEPINAVGPKFVEIVPRCDLQEQLVILQLLVTIAKQKPSCLTESIPSLLELAIRPPLSAAALLVLLKLAEAKPIKLAEYTEAFKVIAYSVPQTVGFAAQILSAIGRSGKDRAQVALDFVLEHLPRADRPLQTILLNEATKLCTKYPVLFTDKVTSVVRQRQLSNSQIKHTTSGGVTIVNLNTSATLPTIGSTERPLSYVQTTTTTANNGHNGFASTAHSMGSSVSGAVAAHHHSHQQQQQQQQQQQLHHHHQHHHHDQGRAIISKTPNVAIVSNHSPMSKTVINTSNGTTLSSTIHPALLTNFINTANGVQSTPPLTNGTGVVSPTPHHTGYTRNRPKLGDSRSTGRLHSGGGGSGAGGNKSTTRLNNAGGSMGGLHKARLGSSSQLINQFSGGEFGTTTGNGGGGGGGGAGVVLLDQEKSTGTMAGGGGLVGSPIALPSNGNATCTTVDGSSSSSNNAIINNRHNSSGNVAIKGIGGTVDRPVVSLLHSSLAIPPVPPPLSQHVTITGENKWGIPQTKITSCGVTVMTTSPTARTPRPYSHGGPSNTTTATLLGSTGALGKSSLGGLNQSTGSIGIQVHHASPASPNTNLGSPTASIPASATTTSATTTTTMLFNNHSQQTSPQLTQTTLSLHSSDDPTSARDQVIVYGPETVTTRHHARPDNRSVTILNASSSAGTMVGGTNPRMSVFEPYPMRDTIQHFCEKHLDKIKAYTESVAQRIPPPAKCIIEERRAKKTAKLHFACQVRGPHCLYARTMFTMRTRNPRTWIHLMFLDLQARAPKNALSSWDPSVSRLKHCWDTLKCENRTFITLVTSAFPSCKEQEALVNELRHAGFFDVFEMGPASHGPDGGNVGELGCEQGSSPTGLGPSGVALSTGTNATTTTGTGSTVKGSTIRPEGSVEASSSEELDEGLQWGCFLCHHPEKAIGFLHGNNQPVIEGQLKEKKGKWRLFRRWRTRYFTLSGAHLSCKGSVSEAGGESIDVNQIRSVKVSRGARNIPKAFEIFTGDQTLILKPKDGNKAEEWVQCLSIVLAHSQARDSPTTRTNSLPARSIGNSRTVF